MKKLVLILLLLCAYKIEKAEDLSIIKLRDLYYKAAISKDASEKFAQATTNFTGVDKTTLAGYYGVSWMMKANHVFNPYNKLSYFLKGKEILDNAIQSNSKNIELRFLRYCVQTNVPDFLAYNSNIISDKNIIFINYANVSDFDLKKRIKEYMLHSKYCTAAEKKFLEQHKLTIF